MANERTVKRNVMATTRTGIPIHRGPLSRFSFMRLGYMIGKAFHGAVGQCDGQTDTDFRASDRN